MSSDVTLVVDALGPRLSGIGRYVLELCNRIPREDGIGTVRYFRHGHFLDDPRALLDGSRPARGRAPRWLARRKAKQRLDRSLVHAPNYLLPREAEKGIITVHDLSIFRFPETHPPERLRVFEREFESSLRRAIHIVTDTEIVRREIVETFGIAEERVSAIPLGVDGSYAPRPDELLGPQLVRWGLEPKAYALCVSTLEPRKRIPALLSAWRALPRSLRAVFPLVLAGPEGWLNADLHDQIREGIADGWLKHLGFLPECDLPFLYAGAQLFLYPSIYEGFGLPPLEAMASCVPVMVSDRSCLPEVCGDAARYCDPDNVAEFADRIAHALSDTAWQAQARSKGVERASRFTWDECAARTAALYRSHGD